jgi:hypothetical protein
MNRTGLWATAAAAMLASGVAVSGVDEADFSLRTTENLYDLCSVAQRSSETSPRRSTPVARFLEATVQYHDAVSDGDRFKRLICYPATATLEDARRAFLAWAEANAGNAKRMAELPVIGRRSRARRQVSLPPLSILEVNHEQDRNSAAVGRLVDAGRLWFHHRRARRHRRAGGRRGRRSDRLAERQLGGRGH